MARLQSRSAGLGLSLAALLLGFASMAPTTASAGPLGVHAGLALNPDQLLLGAQATLPMRGDKIFIVPQAEFGVFNGGSFVVHLDGEFRLGGKDAGMRPYVGAGGTWWGYNPEGDGETSDTFGVNIVGGIATQKLSGKGKFAEIMFFLDDELPDFRFVIGTNF